MEITTIIHKGISEINAHVNDQNIYITVDVSFGRTINTELRRAVNPRTFFNF